MTRILIVDDDAVFAHLLVERLQNELKDIAQVVESVQTAEEALERMARSDASFDILLVDHRLGPGLYGLELIQQLHQSGSNIDTILFTGLDDSEIGIHAFQAGAYRYLTKPFDPKELVLIVKALIRQRATSFEHNWLQLSLEISNQTQAAQSVLEVAQVLVDGALRLGFERSRLYRLVQDANEDIVVGLAQAGQQIPMFIGLKTPLKETTYSRIILDSLSEVTYFHGHEQGKGSVSDRLKSQGFQPPQGEWAGIPLVGANGAIGLLVVDNAEAEREIHPDAKRMLTALSKQASAAFAQAIQIEDQKLRHQASEMVRRVMAQIGDATQTNSLDRLLQVLREEFTLISRTSNFIVLLKGDSDKWLYTRVHMEGGEHLEPYWRHESKISLGFHCTQLGEPIFLPNGTEKYRRHHQIPQVGARSARSWMGVPLPIGDQIIGALILEDDEYNGAFTQTTFELFVQVCHQLAGIIQTAWLHEQQRNLVGQLTVVQKASEQLMLLAEQREKWLWHVTLTVATADYGFRFDRAALFLLDEQEGYLCGKMGLGHFEWEYAEKDWKNERNSNLNFDTYLKLLVAGELIETPVEKHITGWRIPIGPSDGAFRQVLTDGRNYEVPSYECSLRLPKEFTEQFGICDYAVIAVRAGGKVIGLVVLDNVWNKDPQQIRALEHIDRLIDQAGLIYESLKIGQAQTVLLDESHTIHAHANSRSLQASLLEICEKIQSVMGADIMAIYPIEQIDRGKIVYQSDQIAFLGRHSEARIPLMSHKNGFTSYLLKTDTLAVNDVLDHQGTYTDFPLADHSFIKTEQIRALIGIPIRDIRNTDQLRGVLFINYRQPRNFTAQDIRLAKSFARMAALVMRQVREFDALESAKRAREDELKALGEVLEKSLIYHTDEREAVRTLLINTQKLFAPLEVRCTFLQKVWWRDNATSNPIECRMSYSLNHNGDIMGPRRINNLHTGISGNIFQTGQTQVMNGIRDGDIINDDETIFHHTMTMQSAIAAPIKSTNDQVTGVLLVHSSQMEAFTEAHVAMLERMVAPVGLALDNVQRQLYLNNLIKVTQELVAPTELSETLDTIAETIFKIAPDIATIGIWHRDVGAPTGEHLVAHNYNAYETEHIKSVKRKSDSIINRVIQERRSLFVEDVYQDTIFQNSLFTEREQIKSVIAIPLRVSDKSVGAIFFNYRYQRWFTLEERRIFQNLADIIAASISDAINLEEVNRSQIWREKVIEIEDAISRNLALNEVLNVILQGLKELFPFTSPMILLNEAESDRFNVVSYIENNKFRTSTLSQTIHYSDEQTLVSLLINQVKRRKEKLFFNVTDFNNPYFRVKACVEDAGMLLADPKLSQIKPLLNGIQSAFAIVLYSAEIDKIWGVLLLESQQVDVFDQFTEQTLWGIAKQTQNALIRDNMAADLRYKDAVAGATTWAAEIAHDINREIGRIRNRTAWLQDANIAGEYKDYVSEIEESASRLANVWSGSTMDRGESKPVSIGPLLQSWTEAILQKQHRNVFLKVVIEPPEIPMILSVHTLQRINKHLIQNALKALKYIDQPEIKITVTTSSQEWLEISYEDNGHGIVDPVIRQLLFNIPFSTDVADNHQGYGLLFVRDAIERMGGTIRLMPYRPGQGAIFVLRLPLTVQSVSEKEIHNVRTSLSA